MRKEQIIVAIGAASGVVVMALSIWILTNTLPIPEITGSFEERIAFALHANVVAIIPFFIMLITVGNSRFLSEAIDPTRGAESSKMIIDGNVAENTLQQNFVFAIATLSLSTVVPLGYLQIIWACVIVFVVARLIFWLGYRINPLYRAPGMSATAYMNLGIILYLLYFLATK
ncbi:hypothetical protein [Gilvimarinus sp. DA14]|uniref:hypothetical protein n=1 Tax=Gilvimarinus sp. DA14 TaxID=2956798 RepID=UPI0020B63C6B|nr:hypothetical protein [Gilvimarinus sp. DA14]UTF58885.1 hypothetical protein NHM04_10380 [Gilvimarinus sp. DA14]